MSDPWRHPLRDLRLLLTRRGRAVLTVKRRLAAQVVRDRHTLDLARLAEIAEADRQGLAQRFVDWDDEESARIREETIDDLADLYPTESRARLGKLLDQFDGLARDLPLTPPKERA